MLVTHEYCVFALFHFKMGKPGGGGRTGESFNGERVSGWGDKSLLEMDSGNDCTTM